MKRIVCVFGMTVLTWLSLYVAWDIFLLLQPSVLYIRNEVTYVKFPQNSENQQIRSMIASSLSATKHPQEIGNDLDLEDTYLQTPDRENLLGSPSRDDRLPKVHFVDFYDNYNLTRERVMPQEFKSEPQYSSELDDPSLKRILFWNDMYSKYHYSFGLGREPFLRAGCPFNKCITTSNRSRFSLSEIDALIWHFRADDRELPDQRYPETKYVFLMKESPMNLFGDLQPYNGIFNWTLTYRLDSDFPGPAGYIIERPNKLEKLKGTVKVDGKTKLIAWFVSNCKSSSGRESLARSLQMFVPVDIYGKCGQYNCKRSQQTKCYRMLERDYKFYLSFENSLCKDYITEKFFDVIQYNVIPIVWGAGDYSMQAPSHSYINADDFDSVEDLAMYLLYLDGNDTAYEEYFEWKLDYEVITGWAASVRPWCKLCEHLHTDQDVQIYNDLHNWFSKDRDCQSSNSPEVARFTHGEKRIPT